MKAKDNKKFERVVTLSEEEKNLCVSALRLLVESDMLSVHSPLPEAERHAISELYDMLDF